jgi:hypothetical protein
MTLTWQTVDLHRCKDVVGRALVCQGGWPFAKYFTKFLTGDC